MSFLNNVIKRFNLCELLSEVVYVLCGYFLLVISYLIPRNKNKWCFGNKRIFKDNTKYLFLYLLKNKKDIVPIWISSSRKLVVELRRYSFPVYYKYSLKGLYHSLTSGVYITTVNSNHINYFTSGGVFNVYLWHGIALKSMPNAKSLPIDRSILSRICMPYAYEKVDFILSTTPMIDEQFLLTFNLSKKALYSGVYPRCLFMLSDKNTLLSYIKSYEDASIMNIIDKISLYDKTFVYMPTWRINYGSKFLDYAIPNIVLLNEILRKKNYFLLLKLHPSMRYDMYKYQNLKNIYYIEPTVDMYPLLPFTDVLISDYSSIYYDYLLLDNKGVLLYDFDLDSYVNNEFGFFKDYKSYTPGKHVHDFKSLLSAIGSDESFVISANERSWILHEMWGDCKEKNLDDLINEIKRRSIK